MRKLQQGLVSLSMLLGLSGCIFEDTNTEPVASNITLDVNNGVDAIVIEKSFLLNNVNDDDASKLSVTALSLVSGFGELTESSSSYTYTPSVKDFSSVNFSYTVTDGEFTDSASVSATIETDSRVQIQSANGITIYSKLDTTRHSSVNATLYVGNNEFTVTTEAADGSFSFINIPENSSYLIALSSDTGDFATHYSAGTATRTNNEDIFSLGISQLPSAIKGIFKIRNARSGELVSGLKPYIFADELVNQDNQIANLPQVRISLTEEDEQYAVDLFSESLTTNVYVDSLTDVNGEEYSIINQQQALPFIGRISGSEAADVFLSKVETGAFKVILNVETTNDISVASTPLLAFSNLTTNQTEYWTLESNGTYSRSLTAQELSQRRVLTPIDTNEDGVADIIANVSSKTGFPMLSALNISQFNENNELSLTQSLQSVNYNQPMSSNLISSAENFRANDRAEVIIAFDRQVEAPSAVQLNTDALTQNQVQIDLNDTANIFQEDQETLTTTTQGESQLVLGFNNVYSYTDQNGQVRTLALGANNTNQINSPFATEFGSTPTSSSLQSSSFSLQANGTLLVINANPSNISASQNYEFSFTVNATFDSFGPSSISHQIRAENGSSTLLSDIILDNFDFKDSSSLDITTPDSEDYISGMTPHTDLFTELNVGYTGGEANDRAQLKYVDYSIGDLTSIESLNASLSLDNTANSIYLISTAAIEGTIEVLSQTEVFNNSGTAETSTTDLSNVSFEFSTTDNSSDKAFGQLAILLIEPNNHGIDTAGITTVFNAPAASGANVSTPNLYYIYPLALTPMTSGRITDAKIKFNATIGGVRVNAEQDYNIR